MNKKGLLDEMMVNLMCLFPVKSKDTPTSPVQGSTPSVTRGSSYRAYLQRQQAGPANPGSKPIPEGKPNCLSGLTFVITGELDSLYRDQAQDLVKQYGGKVTTSLSKKTSYIVVGREPGNSKMAKVRGLMDHMPPPLTSPECPVYVPLCVSQ